MLMKLCICFGICLSSKWFHLKTNFFSFLKPWANNSSTNQYSYQLFYGRGDDTPRAILSQKCPAKYVSEITSLMINGTPHDSYVLEPNGILRVIGLNCYRMLKHTLIVVEYIAGVPEALMGGLKELIAHRVTHAMASTSGVQSETAGSVSITYNATWANTSRATALADDNKEVLQAYRVQGVF